MPDDIDVRHVSIDEAAELLGVSRRTVQRRLQQGTLKGRKEGNSLLVHVPEEMVDEKATVESLRMEVAQLQARCDTLTQERDTLTRQVSALSDNLAQLAQQNDTLSHQVDEITAKWTQVEGNTAELKKQLDETTRKHDRLARGAEELTHQAEALTQERDWLRKAHEASLMLVAQAQQQQKLLAERAESTRRPWWARLFGSAKTPPGGESLE